MTKMYAAVINNPFVHISPSKAVGFQTPEIHLHAFLHQLGPQTKFLRDQLRLTPEGKGWGRAF